ncbi:hypothetical protein GF324_03370, partial [bacterium]|nr:hypothetical protein [bacterium]
MQLSESRETPPFAGRALWIAAGVYVLARMVLHVFTAYGVFRDEFYYLDCARHLAFGYVDQPPLSIWILRVWTLVFGDSLISIRIPPTLAHAATLLLVGRMTWRFGGGPITQVAAAVLFTTAPFIVALSSFYSMNAFDTLFWALVFYQLLRIVQEERPRDWLWLGVILGLGLLNKTSMLWLGFGLTMGMLLTPQRRWFMTPWPWTAAAIAFLLFSPYILWNMLNDWPTLEFMAGAREKLRDTPPWSLILDQVLMFNPLAVLVWLSGLIGFFLVRSVQSYRIFGYTFLSVLTILMLYGRARSYYLTPAFPPLFAFGAIWLQRRVSRSSKWVFPISAAVIVVFNLFFAPMGTPILPPAGYIAYSE